jgi:UDP-glucose 4-epimerase
MGDYYRISADSRDLNYDKFVVKGNVITEAGEAYTSHNANLLDIDGIVDKLLTTSYVRNALEGSTLTIGEEMI